VSRLVSITTTGTAFRPLAGLKPKNSHAKIIKIQILTGSGRNLTFILHLHSTIFPGLAGQRWSQPFNFVISLVGKVLQICRIATNIYWLVNKGKNLLFLHNSGDKQSSTSGSRRASRNFKRTGEGRRTIFISIQMGNTAVIFVP
jgi:hypothetical protein